MKWLKDYFDLSKREEKGFLALFGIIAILLVLQFGMVYIVPDHNALLADTKTTSQSGNAIKADSNEKGNAQTDGLFSFDPNTLDESGFIRLGLPKLIADHIADYRQKGGRFFHAEDLKKVYGVSDSDYRRLEPFIEIKHEAKRPLTAPVDLNTADSIKLMTVRGIGPTFAGRILAMRKRLGCFVDLDQLRDVFGIGDEKYGFIRPQFCLSKQAVHYLNLNTATVDLLKRNPYIGYKLAIAIVGYRDRLGPLQSKEDLKKVPGMDAGAYLKILPYISVK